MNINTKTSYNQTIFVVQSKISDTTKHADTESWGNAINYCGGEPKWADFDSNYLFGMDGFEYRSNLGANAFICQGDALNALSFLKIDNAFGKFDHKDGYGQLLYRVRKDFKVVEVSLDIKVRDV